MRQPRGLFLGFFGLLGGLCDSVAGEECIDGGLFASECLVEGHGVYRSAFHEDVFLE